MTSRTKRHITQFRWKVFKERLSGPCDNWATVVCAYGSKVGGRKVNFQRGNVLRGHTSLQIERLPGRFPGALRYAGVKGSVCRQRLGMRYVEGAAMQQPDVSHWCFRSF